MISIKQLAEVIQEATGYDQIGPGGATYCAEAVLAAISAAPDNDALDAARFRFIRDVLAHTVETDGEGRVTVKCHDVKSWLPPNLLRNCVGNSPGAALPFAIDALMDTSGTPRPDDPGNPQ